MNDSKMIELEIEKLEKQKEELTKKLSLLKKSKTVIENSEKTKAKNLFYREVNELIAAANLKLSSSEKDLVRLSLDEKLDYIYLHQLNVDPSDFALSRLFLEDADIEEVSQWIDLILENVEKITYLLTFEHDNFDFNDLSVNVDRSILTAYFFSSNDLSLNVSFFKDDTAHISMSNFIDDDFGRVEIDAGEIKYLVESNDAYYGFSLSASIEKDCRFNELDEMIDDAAAKLTNHGVRLA